MTLALGGYPVVGRRGVCLIQNALPFELHEAARFGLSFTRIRYMLLRLALRRAIRSAHGVIFLSEYGRRLIERNVGASRLQAVIPHGVDPSFFVERRATTERARILYVSPVTHYKHQRTVLAAVRMLRRSGLDVELRFVGGGRPSAVRSLLVDIQRSEAASWCDYVGRLPHSELPSEYASARVFVFASTCETLPITLLEAMAAGLPIVSSNYGPMPEIAQDAAIYADPTDPRALCDGLGLLLSDNQLAISLGAKAAQRAKEFTWERAVTSTMQFLSSVAD